MTAMQDETGIDEGAVEERLAALEDTVCRHPLHREVLYRMLAYCAEERALACAFVLFSEKEFDRLFKPEGEASLDDLLGDGLPGPRADDDAHAGKKGRFGLAIDALAEQAGLSRREKDVLRCLAMGYDTGATAKRLQVSWNTVRTHTRNVYAKLDIHARQELIALVDRATDQLP